MIGNLPNLDDAERDLARNYEIATQYLLPNFANSRAWQGYKTLFTTINELRGELNAAKAEMARLAEPVIKDCIDNDRVEFADANISDYVWPEIKALLPKLGVRAAFVSDLSCVGEFPKTGGFDEKKRVWQVAIDELRGEVARLTDESATMRLEASTFAQRLEAAREAYRSASAERDAARAEAEHWKKARRSALEAGELLYDVLGKMKSAKAGDKMRVEDPDYINAPTFLANVRAMLSMPNSHIADVETVLHYRYTQGVKAIAELNGGSNNANARRDGGKEDNQRTLPDTPDVAGNSVSKENAECPCVCNNAARSNTKSGASM